MKKIASILLMGAAIASCGSAPENMSYEINGSYADTIMNNKTLYLMAGDSIVDSTVVAGKNFAFKGETDTVLVYRIAGKAMMRGQLRYNTLTPVILQKGSHLTITVDKDVTLDDEGGVNQIWNDFNKKYSQVKEEKMKIYRELIANEVSQDSLDQFVGNVQEEMENLWRKSVADNADNLAGAAIFSNFCRGVRDAAMFDSIFNTLKYADLFESIRVHKEFMKALDNTSEGKMFVDFSGKSLDGNDVKLSDFVGQGKYVLVDFWASWCGPCRGEIPNLLKVNKKYSGKNFEVVGVDVWDEVEKFNEAVKVEKINYAQIFTEEDTATKLYGITGIPQIMLFAPDGTVVKRNLRGDAIEATVKECLKK